MFFLNATAFESKHDRVLKKHGQGSSKPPKQPITLENILLTLPRAIFHLKTFVHVENCCNFTSDYLQGLKFLTKLYKNQTKKQPLV